jgi:hypothetical protein
MKLCGFSELLRHGGAQRLAGEGLAQHLTGSVEL